MIDRSASRAAVMNWRDDAALEAMALVHAASARAMEALEARIDDVAWTDIVTDAERAASAVIRPAMRQRLAAPIDRWFAAQAEVLGRIDPGLAAITVQFAALDNRPALPVEAPVATPSSWRAPGWLRGPLDTIGSAAERAASEVASRALPDAVRTGAGRLSTLVGQEIGARSGAHERLRSGGRAELSRTWLGGGEAGTRPYLTQLLDRVDHTAMQARSLIE